MKQDPVWRSGRFSDFLARQPEVDAAIGRVAEREPSQHAIACDGVEIARDAMLHVVKPGRGRLADAVRFIAVPLAAGEPRNERGAHQALGVDDIIVGARPKDASEASNLAPCRWCK
jgi:hypothetical protein